MKTDFIRTWLKDFRGIMGHELRQMFSDSGVILIFLVAGLLYPILYNIVYRNGILNDTPIAVVDNADCVESRRFIRKFDATREVSVQAECMNMDEARRLMQERKVNGIVCFPPDFGKRLERKETSRISLYADMSSFLYYKNALIAANQVMLNEIGQIQIERCSAAGLTGQSALENVKPLGYEENNPFNRAFDYSFFLVSAILMIIIQQTLFYGMSLLAGTAREQNHSFATLPDRLAGNGVGRIVLGRGGAYWLLYLAIGTYIVFIVPAMFGIPQRGGFPEVTTLLLFFITDCVFFSMTWSTLITRRESVFILFLAMSPICLFLSGCSWPTEAFPRFWKVFSYIFPSTFGVQGFINLSSAGGDFGSAALQFKALTAQTIVYFFLSCAAVHVENWVIHHKEAIRERKRELDERLGIDNSEDASIISGEGV